MPLALPPLLHLGVEVTLRFQMPSPNSGVLPVAPPGRHPHCELVGNGHSPLFHRVSAGQYQECPFQGILFCPSRTHVHCPADLEKQFALAGLVVAINAL